jgi:hypothetical protein
MMLPFLLVARHAHQADAGDFSIADEADASKTTWSYRQRRSKKSRARLFHSRD